MDRVELGEMQLRSEGEDAFVDAYKTFGVRMGDGFIETLRAPMAVKDLVENESRNQHGKRVVRGNIKLASRTMTLTFRINADTPAELNKCYSDFCTFLYKVFFELKLPKVSDDVYRLRYMGQSATYGQNVARTSCAITAKFEEPNPHERTNSAQ